MDVAVEDVVEAVVAVFDVTFLILGFIYFFSIILVCNYVWFVCCPLDCKWLKFINSFHYKI